ncbi:ATP-dependent helicase smarcad1 [Coelomomyces lativittatus]|nr:ATP-dependent helicase smarcad1 [Coelomomyces lativittatus]KAJ1513846.1 ATP-dependent helicase smarcad1 [Coelomomyces lativittatus]
MEMKSTTLPIYPFSNSFTSTSEEINSISSSVHDVVLETPLKLQPASKTFYYYSNEEQSQGTRRLLSNSRFKDLRSVRDKHMFSKSSLTPETPPSTLEDSSNILTLSHPSTVIDLDSWNHTNEPSPPKRKKKRLVKKADLIKRQLDLGSEGTSDEQTDLYSSRNTTPSLHYDPSPSPSLHENENPNENQNGKEIVHVDEISTQSSSDLHFNEKTLRKKEVLNFFNTATVDVIHHTLQCSLSQAELLVSLRPYDTFEMLNERIQSTKGLSNRLVDTYLSITDSMSTLDGLVFKCTNIQTQLTSYMDAWPSELSQPSTISHQLKSYQKFGVAWLTLLYDQKLSGGILADEMGLGKTAQVIGLIASLTEKQISGPHLIICPVSTLEHWVREFTKWLPSCSTFVYYGNHLERKYLQYDIKHDMPDVIITAYHTASNSKDDRVFLRKLKCNVVVLDEGHKVKNAGTQTNKHLAKLTSSFRLLLTGTPLQNNLHELVSLLTFILPETFQSKCDWQNILNLKSIDAVSKQMILKIKCLMQPFILRRKKCHVLQDLPKKHVHMIPCIMEGHQKDFYRSIQNDACLDTSTKQRIQHYLMTLRKAAAHPLLFRLLYTDTKVHAMAKTLLREEPYWEISLEDLYEDLKTLSDFQLHSLALKYKSSHSLALQNQEWMHSAKLIHLKSLLSQFFKNEDRCLIFSQFTLCLDILEAFLNELNYKYVRLDGSTPVEERQYLVDMYNDNADIFIFLISTRAGGLGLNLTAANVVIIHDLDFNPHNDTQAEDRAWRLGQTKPVHVFKLVCQDTVEEIIYKRQLAKLELDYQMTNDDASILFEDEKFKVDFLKHVASSHTSL